MSMNGKNKVKKCLAVVGIFLLLSLAVVPIATSDHKCTMSKQTNGAIVKQPEEHYFENVSIFTCAFRPRQVKIDGTHRLMPGFGMDREVVIDGMGDMRSCVLIWNRLGKLYDTRVPDLVIIKNFTGWMSGQHVGYPLAFGFCQEITVKIEFW